MQLAYLDKKSHERYLISSPSILAGVNIILVISFLSRGLYQFGTIFSIFLLPDIPLQVEINDALIVCHTSLCCLYFYTTLYYLLKPFLPCLLCLNPPFITYSTPRYTTPLCTTLHHTTPHHTFFPLPQLSNPCHTILHSHL